MEKQIFQIIRSGARRFRLNSFLWWASLGTGLSLSALILMILVVKIFPMIEWSFLNFAWLPVIIIAGTILFGLMTAQPSLDQVAYQIDRRAGLEDHLTTWFEFHTQRSTGDHLKKAFIEAQEKETFHRLQRIKTSGHIPIRPPAWSPVLWLGFLFLGCALLMPAIQDPSESRAERLRKARREQEGTAQEAEKRRLSKTELSNDIKLNPFSKTELFKMQLDLMNKELSAEEVEKLLEAFETKIAGLSESQLPDDVKSMLSQLRRRAGKKDDGTKRNAGSVRMDEHGGDQGTASASKEVQGPARFDLSSQELASIIHTRFPDVEEDILRYLKVSKGKGARQADGG